MRTDGKAERQHYVPQLLLRLHVNDSFAARGTEQVWCFDKTNDKVFSSNIRGILAEARFNEIEIDGTPVSLEERLTRIEDRVAPILDRLIRTRRLGEIRGDERRTLAAFCAFQFVRTQAFRERIRDLNGAVATALRERGIDPSQISNFKMLSKDEIKALSLKMLVDAPQTYGPYFLDKWWYLIPANIENPFHLGDHPVVLDNDLVPGAYGGLGLACPGVSIYLPLCPTLCLAMTDSSAVADLVKKSKRINEGYIKIKRRASRRPSTAEGTEILLEMKRNRSRIMEQVLPLKRGTPTAYNPEFVIRVNSLQMSCAARWIISSQPDFSLPKQMIADNERFRKPSCVVVG